MAQILIIDDDRHLRYAVRTALEEAGHDVREAGDGKEGLQACAEQSVNLVLCDLFMPGKEGLETIIELRQRFPGVPIIAVSGGHATSGMDCLPMAAKLGAEKIVYKPFDMNRLLALIQGALDEKQSSGKARGT